MSKQLIIWTLFTLVCFVTGCTEKQAIAPEPRCLSGVDVNSAMRASELVLVGMNFVIDKEDPNLNLITTKPLAGGQFFEPWRQDNVGSYNHDLSNLHTIRRTVELGFNNNNSQVCIVCKVTIERLSIPEKQMDSTARSYSLFSQSNQTMQHLTLNAEQEKKMDWIDLGRDNRLETYILDKIDKKITGKKKGK
jgi:hypothetical protein